MVARAPNKKAAEAEAMYRDGIKLVDIAKKLDVPPGTVRRWKSTYQWDNLSEESKTSVRKNESERSEKLGKNHKGGQPGNTNALKNATYANEYWKNITDEERVMMANMPLDEEIHLIESLKLTVLREKRYLSLLERYRTALQSSPDGMVLREDIKSCIQEMNSKGSCIKKTATMQQTKVDAVEQMQIIEAELTRVQKVKIKIIDSLTKIRRDNKSFNGVDVNEAQTVNIYLPDNGRS